VTASQVPIDIITKDVEHHELRMKLPDPMLIPEDLFGRASPPDASVNNLRNLKSRENFS
jgi:hypothetical protein